jgi:glycosyltransferase 2 family protein
MSRTAWAWARPVGGGAILAVLVWRLGTGPILDGLRTINGWSLAAAGGIAIVTTACCAWRWTLVARGLGVGLPLPTAIAAYYRSQFLNTTLPGGVLGDVHRAVRHGRDVGDVGRGVRAVAWERTAGQVVQAALALVVLLALPSPARRAMPVVVAVVVVAVLTGALAIRALSRRGRLRWRRILHIAGDDIARRTRWGIVLASAVAVAGHAATFLVAARTAGSTASPVQMLPLAMLVLLAMGVPTNIGGWGPREGVAAWMFGAAGLGAGQGVAVATVYGVLVLAASLPGAAVLLGGWLGRRRREVGPQPSGSLATGPDAARALVPAGIRHEGAVRA